MATLDWIAKTVDTAGRPCPVRLAEACPGNRQQCAWWLDEVLEKGATGAETAVQGGCGLLWLYAIQHEVRSEAIRTQAGLDKTATEVRQAGQAVRQAAQGVAAAILLRPRVLVGDGGPPALEPGDR
jgi:hypothetical protein